MKKKRARNQKPIPTDDFGCREGSKKARINAALVSDVEWQTEEQIAKAAGLTVKEVRRWLYKATRVEKLFEHRALLQYRLK